MDRIESYLLQCRVRSPFEQPDVRVPPTPAEARALIAELQHRGLSPVIVGSVAVFHHLSLLAHEYRPTADLDIWIARHPGQPLPGWRVDVTSPGVLSWISPSPSNGYVDFLIAGQNFPSGSRSPLHVRRSAFSDEAEILDLLTMKLNTMREKDFSDCLILCKALGHVPVEGNLGRLTDLQKENLELVRLWLSREHLQH